MPYNPYEIDNRRDEVEANIERNRLERDGFIARPITRTLPPTAGTAEDADARGPQPHPAAGDAFPDVTASLSPCDMAVIGHMRETGSPMARKAGELWTPDNHELMYGAFGKFYERHWDRLYACNERKA